MNIVGRQNARHRFHQHPQHNRASSWVVARCCSWPLTVVRHGKSRRIFRRSHRCQQHFCASCRIRLPDRRHCLVRGANHQHYSGASEFVRASREIRTYRLPTRPIWKLLTFYSSALLVLAVLGPSLLERPTALAKNSHCHSPPRVIISFSSRARSRSSILCLPTFPRNMVLRSLLRRSPWISRRTRTRTTTT